MRIVRAALLAALVACGGDDTPANAGDAPPQAATTTPTVPAGEYESSAKIIQPNESPAFPNPADLAALQTAHPPLSGLTELQQKLVVAVVNSVPAPCVACIDQSLGRCVVDHAVVCPVVPLLVHRATLLAARNEAPNRIREAVLLSDLWFDVPQTAPALPESTGPVRLEVWVDPASSFLTPAVRVIEKLPMQTVSVVVRVVVDPERPASRELVTGFLAAQRQGRGLAYLQAIERWRSDMHDQERLGADPFAEDAAAAIALLMVDDGLDLAAWTAARGDARAAERIAADAALAPDLGVRSTPTWFVNGFRLRGAQSDQALGRLIALEAEATEWQASGLHVSGR